MAEGEFEVRAAGRGDLEPVLALVGAIVELPHWPKDVWMTLTGDYQDKLRGRLMLLGLDEAGQICGLAAGMTVSEVAELEYVWVDKRCRGRGLGRAMVQRWIAWAKEQRTVEVFLEVRSSNEAAMALYRGLGFAQQGMRPEYYQAPVEDALVLRLGLGADEGVAAV